MNLNTRADAIDTLAALMLLQAKAASACVAAGTMHDRAAGRVWYGAFRAAGTFVDECEARIFATFSRDEARAIQICASARAHTA